MRIVLVVALLGAFAPAASSCGGGEHKAAPPPPRWVQKANALCNVDDRAFKNAAFDSAAEIEGLQREANGLLRLGFFKHVPAAAVELATAGRLLTGVSGNDFDAQRRSDRLLIRARQAAAREGVHCSFGAFPLQNL